MNKSMMLYVVALMLSVAPVRAHAAGAGGGVLGELAEMSGEMPAPVEEAQARPVAQRCSERRGEDYLSPNAKAILRKIKAKGCPPYTGEDRFSVLKNGTIYRNPADPCALRLTVDKANLIITLTEFENPYNPKDVKCATPGAVHIARCSDLGAQECLTYYREPYESHRSYYYGGVMYYGGFKAYISVMPDATFAWVKEKWDNPKDPHRGPPSTAGDAYVPDHSLSWP